MRRVLSSETMSTISRGHSVPPGPELSRLAALRAFRRDPIGLLSQAANFGDVAYLKLPRFPAYLLNHPDLVHDVLVTGSQKFMKGPTMQAAKLVLGESLLTSEGDDHRRQRRMIQPIFHRDRIEGFADAMVERAARASERWQAGEILDMHREMAGLTLAVVGATLFGIDIEAEETRSVGQALALQLSMFGRVFSPLFRLSMRLPLPSNRRFERSKAALDDVIDRMIARRRSTDATGEDVLSLLIRAQEDGTGMSDAQVRDEAMTLLLAGHETTSNALTWTWYLLSQHADVEAKLHAELDEVLGGRLPTVADVPRLRLTEMVLTESMRILPPAWAIGRRALVDHHAGSYVVPAGSVVIVSPYLVHHDPRWYEDPEAFVPERWRDEERSRRPRNAYLPFGAGPRMCVGEHFARLEGVLVLATIAQRWRLDLVPGHRVELQPVVTLRPKHGMAMTADRRG
ncbi:MAG TPA: cytochrome P450 [Actinomycetota bacterium]|nr:cytochrome P450 [Actinomycetota bacterium]